MFKLAHNGNILMDVAQTMPPSAAFIVEALGQSPFADCEIDHDAISAYFQSEVTHSKIIVAKQLDAQFSVSLSDDKMQANATLITAKGGKPISLDEAKRVIIQAGVSRGYKQVYLEKVLNQQFKLDPGAEFHGVVAYGRPPEDGQDAKLYPHVKTLKERLRRPKMRDDGTVDMRDFGKLESVVPGTVLITQRPATPGKAGFTVTGDNIDAKPGNSFKLTAGEGTAISHTNPLELVATIAGCPSDIPNGMRVDDVFTTSEVNVKSGHIDFNGSVIVTRNVAPGMKIHARGDVTVFGSVESAEIHAGGHVEIKGGAIGHLDHKSETRNLTCKVTAKHDVTIAHSQYTYIEATNVNITKQSNHCDIKALQAIKVGMEDNPNGKLFGGEIMDAQSVEAGEIGSESGAKMCIYLARSGMEITKETDALIRELSQTDDNLDQLQKAIEKADMVKDGEKKKQLMAKISATQQHYCQQAESLESKLGSLDDTLHALLDNTLLMANKALHSGVEIHIFDRVFKTTRSYPPCTAMLKDNKVDINFKTH